MLKIKSSTCAEAVKKYFNYAKMNSRSNGDHYLIPSVAVEVMNPFLFFVENFSETTNPYKWLDLTLKAAISSEHKNEICFSSKESKVFKAICSIDESFSISKLQQLCLAYCIAFSEAKASYPYLEKGGITVNFTNAFPITKELLSDFYKIINKPVIEHKNYTMNYDFSITSREKMLFLAGKEVRESQSEFLVKVYLPTQEAYHLTKEGKYNEALNAISSLQYGNPIFTKMVSWINDHIKNEKQCA